MRSRVVNCAACLALLCAAIPAVVAEDGDDGEVLVVYSPATGLVNLSVDKSPLGTVLTQLGAEAGFEVVIHGELPETISLEVSDATLAGALRRLIEPHSYVLLGESAVADNSTAPLQRLDVFSTALSGQASGSERLEVPGPTPRDNEELGYVDDPDPLVRRAALTQAYGMDPNQAVPLLGDVVAGHADPQVRAGAIAVLVDMAGEGAFDAVSASLGDERPELRLAGARALLRLDENRAVHNLGQLLYADKDPVVRREAARLLAGRDHSAARALLLQFVEDEDDIVRGVALGTASR